MKKVKLFFSILSIIFFIAGCGVNESNKEVVNSFIKNFNDENYDYARSLYYESKPNKETKESIGLFLDEVLEGYEQNLSKKGIKINNIDKFKKSIDCIEEIKGVESTKNIRSKLKKIEEEKKEEEEKIQIKEREVKRDKKEVNEKANNNVVYKKYINSRYGFSIDYPDFLTKVSYSENGDGIHLTNKNEDVILGASGRNNVLYDTVESEYKKTLRRYSNITYKKVFKNGFVVSGIENGNIFYINEVVGEGSINSFYIGYPGSKEKEFDSIVTRIYKSFKTGNLAMPY